MAKLIDADTVVTIQVYDDMTEKTDTKKMTIAEAIDEWSDEGCPPTVDAEPVVRCKDCVYSYPFDEEELKDLFRVGEWHCEFWYAEMHEDDYCSCGKRRENGK